MQMRERGRQRGEIYSRHENGASVSEIRSSGASFKISSNNASLFYPLE